MTRLLADDNSAIDRSEASDETNLALLATGQIPGDPKAIRVTAIVLGVVLLELFAIEHEFPIRRDFGGVSVRLVERINHQRPVDLDGFNVALRVKAEPAAEAAHRRLAFSLHDGVSPAGDDFHRCLGCAVGPFTPRNALLEIELRA